MLLRSFGNVLMHFPLIFNNLHVLVLRNCKENPLHPSLQFKAVKNGAYRSVRVNLGYRALGIPIEVGVQWFWIGSHADYDKLLN